MKAKLALLAVSAAIAAVGSTSDNARLRHVHPQWLFFFETGDLRCRSRQCGAWEGSL